MSEGEPVNVAFVHVAFVVGGPSGRSNSGGQRRTISSCPRAKGLLPGGTSVSNHSPCESQTRNSIEIDMKVKVGGETEAERQERFLLRNELLIIIHVMICTHHVGTLIRLSFFLRC